MWRKLIDRFKEPSTFAGLAVLASLFGVRPETASLIADAAVSVATAGTAPNPATVISAITAVLAVGAVVVKEKAAK